MNLDAPDDFTDEPLPDLARDFAVHEQRFTTFARSFLGQCGDGDKHILLKLDHSLRVLGHARRIVAAEEADPLFRHTVALAALYHDVGRFPQYAKYRTYYDPGSVNHALLGVRTLKEHGFLRGQAAPDPATRRLATTVVGVHNRRSLPPGLPPTATRMAHMGRDADKLDVMRIMHEHFSGDQDDPVVTLHVESHPTKYTPKVLEQVLSDGPADYKELVYSNDFMMLVCGWSRDLNFPESRAILRESGHMRGLLELLPQDEDMDRLRETLLEELEKA